MGNDAELDARDFGLPQARERVFTISVLNGESFNFDDLIKTEMRSISEYLETDVSEVYTVTQPSVYNAIGKKGIRRATVIKDYAYTITARQDRTPAQVIDLGGGKYRYLTERECWRLQGYSDADFEAAAAVQKKNGRYTMALYKQAGNSIPVTIFESIFRKIILGETADGLAQSWAGETVFCNPPYSRKTKTNAGQIAWVQKCYKEATEGGIVVVMLIPARTDTIMFHDYILGKAEIRFIKGRVNFEVDGQKSKDPAPFPSMIVVFNGKQPTSEVKSITA